MRDQFIEQAVFRVAGQNRRTILATPQKRFSAGDIQAALARLPVMTHDAVLFQGRLDLLNIEGCTGRRRCLGQIWRENEEERCRRQNNLKQLKRRGFHSRSCLYTPRLGSKSMARFMGWTLSCPEISAARSIRVLT